MEHPTVQNDPLKFSKEKSVPASPVFMIKVLFKVGVLISKTIEKIMEKIHILIDKTVEGVLKNTIRGGYEIIISSKEKAEKLVNRVKTMSTRVQGDRNYANIKRVDISKIDQEELEKVTPHIWLEPTNMEDEKKIIQDAIQATLRDEDLDYDDVHVQKIISCKEEVAGKGTISRERLPLILTKDNTSYLQSFLMSNPKANSKNLALLDPYTLILQAEKEEMKQAQAFLETSKVDKDLMHLFTQNPKISSEDNAILKDTMHAGAQSISKECALLAEELSQAANKTEKIIEAVNKSIDRCKTIIDSCEYLGYNLDASNQKEQNPSTIEYDAKTNLQKMMYNISGFTSKAYSTLKGYRYKLTKKAYVKTEDRYDAKVMGMTLSGMEILKELDQTLSEGAKMLVFKEELEKCLEGLEEQNSSNGHTMPHPLNIQDTITSAALLSATENTLLQATESEKLTTSECMLLYNKEVQVTIARTKIKEKYPGLMDPPLILASVKSGKIYLIENDAKETVYKEIAKEQSNIHRYFSIVRVMERSPYKLQGAPVKELEI